MLFGLVLLIWSLTPIYNMWMIALDSHDAIFSGTVWPDSPTLESFRVVVTNYKRRKPARRGQTNSTAAAGGLGETKSRKENFAGGVAG